jgi:replication factor C subunit 3/5
MSALWVDKYRPQSLDRLDYHKEQAAQLARLAAAGDLPHMLFYGPSGAGKKTRVMALLRAIFGAGVERVKLQHRAFKTPSGKAIEVTTIASAYHIERVARSARRARACAAVPPSRSNRAARKCPRPS